MDNKKIGYIKSKEVEQTEIFMKWNKTTELLVVTRISWYVQINKTEIKKKC